MLLFDTVNTNVRELRNVWCFCYFCCCIWYSVFCIILFYISYIDWYLYIWPGLNSDLILFYLANIRLNLIWICICTYPFGLLNRNKIAHIFCLVDVCVFVSHINTIVIIIIIQSEMTISLNKYIEWKVYVYVIIH